MINLNIVSSRGDQSHDATILYGDVEATIYFQGCKDHLNEKDYSFSLCVFYNLEDRM